MKHSVNGTPGAGTVGALASLAAAAVAAPALGQSLGDMAADAAVDIEQGTTLFEVIFYLAGIVMIGFALNRFRTLSDGRGTFVGATGLLLVGAGLILLPAVFNALLETLGATGTATIAQPRLQ